MKTVKVDKAAKRKTNVRRSATVCFCVAITLVIITYIMNLPEIRKSLQDVYAWFERIENYIAGYDKVAAFGIIMSLFAMKSVVAFIPFSVLFISSGMVFSAPVAMGVSVLGFALIISVKFFWGKKFGGGNAHKLAFKSKSVTRFMDFNGTGNKWMLVVLRFVPFVPVGTVSRAYGATDMKYLPFVGLSVLGFLPRVVLWSFVGTNIFDPFTPTFMAPIIVLLIISGISLLIWDAVLD